MKKLAVLALCMGLAAIAGAAGAQTKPPAKDIVLKDDAQCTLCHDESDAKAPRVLHIGKTKHGTRADGRTPTCVSCHGKSEQHIADADKGAKQPALPDISFSRKSQTPMEQRSQACLACHQGGTRTHWQMNLHASRDVACSACHDVHTQYDRVRDKETQTQVCFTCHQDVRAQISRPSRHPIKEGKVACSDCHNAHGGAGEKQLVRDSVNDTCYGCHMEKRGPFVRTHQPVQENCSICHDPHGTTNPSLLKIRQPFLCQSCHEPSSHRGTIPTAAPVRGPVTLAGGLAPNPGLSQGVVMARGCLNCHTHIHGTNNPVDLAGERSFRR